jgi:hypothetical protein
MEVRQPAEIAPIDELDPAIEEMEEIIAPGVGLNHNETLVVDDLPPYSRRSMEVHQPAQTAPVDELDTAIEEMEQIIAPGTNLNHNETFVVDDFSLI